MSKTLGGVAACMCCLLVACGGGAGKAQQEDALPRPSQTDGPLASPSSQAAASTVTASPACEDPGKDSTGNVDLTSVAVDASREEVLFVYTYSGTLPTTGSLLFSTLNGSKQYGYKSVDGKKSSHFIFDFASSKQREVEAEASVTPTEATVSFARGDVDIDGLAGGTATISIDGQDIDQCELREPA